MRTRSDSTLALALRMSIDLMRLSIIAGLATKRPASLPPMSITVDFLNCSAAPNSTRHQTATGVQRYVGCASLCVRGSGVQHRFGVRSHLDRRRTTL